MYVEKQRHPKRKLCTLKFRVSFFYFYILQILGASEVLVNALGGEIRAHVEHKSDTLSISNRSQIIADKPKNA